MSENQIWVGELGQIHNFLRKAQWKQINNILDNDNLTQKQRERMYQYQEERKQSPMPMGRPIFS